MVPEKLKRYLGKPLLVNRIVYYLLIFILVLSGFAIVLLIFDTLSTDFSIINNITFAQYNTTQLTNMGFFDNERYLISALVQSLAATIALVITLSLVAVQLAAQSYSTRVIDVYKKNPDMWILLCIYIAVIFYGLGLLKVIDIGVAGINMEFAIFAAYFLGFFAFICLVPYMVKTLDLLKPSVLMKISAEKITKDNVLKALNDDIIIDEIDPIQPVIDIINSALEKNDYETIRNGLKVITNSTVSILEEAHFESGEEDKFARYLIDAIQNVAIYAIKKENENSTLSVVINLGIIGIKAVKQERETATQETAKALGNVGTKAAEQKQETVTLEAVKTLGNIGTEAVVQELKVATREAAKALGNVGTKAAEQKQEATMQEAAKALGNIGTEAIVQNNPYSAEEAVKALGSIGTKAAEKEPDYIANETVKELKKVGEKAAEQRVKEVAEQAVRALKIVGKKSVEQELEWLAAQTVEALGNVGTKAAEQELKGVLFSAVLALEIIGIKAVEKELEWLAGNTAIELGNVGTKAAEKGFERSFRQSKRMLNELHEKFKEKNWNDREILEILQSINFAEE